MTITDHRQATRSIRHVERSRRPIVITRRGRPHV